MSSALTYFLTIITAVLSVFSTFFYVKSLQQGGYKLTKIIDKNNLKLVRFTVCQAAVTLVFLTLSLLLYFTYQNLIFVSNIIEILIFILLFIEFENKTSKITPIFTNRIKRLYVLLFFLTAIFYLIINYFLPVEIVLVILASFPVTEFLLVIFSFVITCPFEQINNYRYVKRAKEKFDKTKAIKIGVTGSYAKTSVKIILKTLLEENFNVVAFDKNYNTPLGIAITSNNLTDKTEVFIAEMGAKKQGDIRKLTKIFKPDIAVITGICAQHFETFKSVENIIKTKSEIYENFTDKNVVFFASNSEYVIKMYKDFGGRKFLAGDMVYAKDVQLFYDHTEFTLVINNNKERCKTKLLGENAVENIVLCSLVANKLGLEIEDIKRGIERLEYIPHRLELIQGNITVLDDSYNANVVGITNSLGVLSLFSKEKNALVSGLIEQGINEKLANFDFGVRLGEVCDNVILIDTKQSEYVKKGILKANPCAKIFTYKSVNEALTNINKVVKEDSVLLITADLPENYTK